MQQMKCRRGVRRGLCLVLVLAGAALSLTSCYGSKHPDPPPVRTTVIRGDDSRLGPTRTSPATIGELNGLAGRQKELFDSGYTLSARDAFTVHVLNHPELSSHVTVLPDGRFFFGFLGRNIQASGRTIEDIVTDLVYGDPPLEPCKGCGWFHPPGSALCPVCQTVRGRLVDTARVIPSSIALHAIQAAGGPVHPTAQPLRQLAPPVGQTDFIIICQRAVIGLDFRNQVEARVTWNFPTHTTVLARPAPGDTLDPQTGPLMVRAGRRWLRLDLVDGTSSFVPPDMAAGLQPWDLPLAPRPNGLNYHFEDPQVMIADYVSQSSDLAVKVVGAVNEPGQIEIRPGSRLWDVITDAGGPKVSTNRGATFNPAPTRDIVPNQPTVDWNSAMLLREERFLPRNMVPQGVTEGSMVRLQVDFAALVKGDPSQNIPVFPGDVLYIPEYAPETISVLTLGEVRSGENHMQRPAWLLTLLARVGWLDERRADLGSILLVRRPQGPRGDRELYVVNAMAVAKGKAPDIELEDGDVLYVYKDLITDVQDALAKIGPVFAAPARLANSTYDAWNGLFDRINK